MRKLIYLIIIYLFLLIDVNALEIDSKYAVLYNLNDEEVVFDLNKDERTSIASLTKIMTTLVAIENINNYDEKVTIKGSMFKGLYEEGAAVIGLKNNQQVTYNDLLYGMFLSSGADATRAIAISISGSEEEFVKLMNKKAQQLKLANTHFANTVGLDNDNHYSTVNDVAIILENALLNEKFKEIFISNSYTFTDKSLRAESTLRKTSKNYNLNDSSIIGAKTGYTYRAGRCLASISHDEANNIDYLLVTTNASTIPNHIKDAITIYDYYSKNYKYHKLVEKNDLLIRIPTKYSKEKEISFFAKKDILKYLNNNFNKQDVKLNYKGKNIITPNMKVGDELGIINVIYNDNVIDEINIKLERKIKFSLLSFIHFYKTIFILLIGFVILFIIGSMAQLKR